MPRLVGKRPNRGPLWTVLLLLVAIAGVGTLEYKGYTDWVPEVPAQGAFNAPAAASGDE